MSRLPDSHDMAAAAEEYADLFGLPITEDRQDVILAMLEDCDDLDAVQMLCDAGEVEGSEGQDIDGLSTGEFDVISDMLERRCGWTWRNGWRGTGLELADYRGHDYGYD